MSDKLRNLGEYFRRVRDDADYATKRDHPRELVERMVDTFDFMVPYEFEFRAPKGYGTVLLDLNFKPPTPTGCCADEYCSVCETFAASTIENRTIQTTWGYIQDSVNLFIRDILVTSYIQTDPSGGIITLTDDPIGDIRVCYVYSFS